MTHQNSGSQERSSDEREHDPQQRFRDTRAEHNPLPVRRPPHGPCVARRASVPRLPVAGGRNRKDNGGWLVTGASTGGRFLLSACPAIQGRASEAAGPVASAHVLAFNRAPAIASVPADQASARCDGGVRNGAAC